jgi:hypothetical protein
MRSDETLREYTNRYFENRNTLAGVKDNDVIAYYKKGITNIKLFEKIHEADAKTIGDLMAYVDKLVDTQDAVMHDFNREDHDDRGTRSRKRSGEAYVTDPPRPSTFLEGDFNMVMDDQCQFYRDAKHTMRECEQLKRALGVPSTSKTRSNNNDDRNGGQCFNNCNHRPDRRDYHDHRPYPHNDDRDRCDYRLDYRLDDRRDDYCHDDRNDRRDDHRSDRRDDRHNDRRDDRCRQDDHNRQDNNQKERTLLPPPKGGNPNGAFQKANRKINFIVGGRQAIKSNRQTRSNAREPKTRDLCGGPNS